MKYVLVLALLLTVQSPLMADTVTPETRADIELSRALINDKRNSALAFNMSFTEEERKAFWPLYQNYRDAMSKVGTRKLDVIIDYSNHHQEMTEDKAADLLRRTLIYEEQALQVKMLYMEKFAEILPPTKVGRLYQIESRMDAAIAVKLSEGIPLME